MNVAAVQKHFRDLAAFVGLAQSATKAAAELAAVADAFEPFRNVSVADFAALLLRAEEYHRTGKLEPPPKQPARKPATAKKGNAAETVQRITALYANILSPDLTAEIITTELALLDPLKKAELLTVAEAVGIHDQVKKFTKEKALQMIKKAIRDRRGMFHRPDY